MDFKNFDSLFNEIRYDIKELTRDVGGDVLELMRDSIATNVYDVYQPVQYQRSPSGRSFIGSWEDAEIAENANGITISIQSNPNKMIYDPKKFQHGNDMTDRRWYMDEIIEEGTNYDFMSPIIDIPRDYYNPVIEDLDQNNMFDVFVIRRLPHYVDKFQFKKI